MRAIGARAIPVPERIDIYHLTTEYPATDQTALEAVMAVDEERLKVERDIEELNDQLTSAAGAGGGGGGDLVGLGGGGGNCRSAYRCRQ